MADETEAQMPPFPSQPLGADGIRVIAFDDEERTSPTIHLKLQHIKRPSAESSSPPYHCLSWTWGQGKRNHLILIDKSPFYVTRNLHDALRHLRSDASFSSPSFLLWIDMICINQSDDDEKNIQVVRMSDTYKDARKVIVWLGDYPERREATGEVASFLSEHLPPIPDGQTYVGPKPEYLLEQRNAAILRALCQDVLRRPWWWRMWVIQEVALARSILVLCDGHHLSWEHLVYTTQWIRILNINLLKPEAQGLYDTNPYLPNINFKSMYRHKHVFGGDVDLPILELLQNASSCLATNPKDMIYSLVGLATDIEASNHLNNEDKLVVDYSEETSVEQVYIDFAKLHIHTHKENPLEIITFSRPNPERRRSLPSWVPDWSNLRDTACYSLATPSVGSKQRAEIIRPYFYHVSGTKSQTPEVTPDNGLRVKGIRFDTVSQVGEPYEGAPGEDISLVIEQWETLALGERRQRSTDSYPCSDQPLWTALDRTLVADIAVDGSRLGLPEGYLFLRMALQYMSGVERLRFGISGAAGQTALSDRRRAAQLRCVRRRFFITSKGFFGLGPKNMEKGDVVFVLYGCNVPVVLRRNGQFWAFVGEAFVAGIMDGEVIDAQGAGNSESGDGEEDGSASLPEVQDADRPRPGSGQEDRPSPLLEAQATGNQKSGKGKGDRSASLLEVQAADNLKPANGEEGSSWLLEAQAAGKHDTGNNGENGNSSLLKGIEESIEIR
jgi:hypothetical protein